MTVFISPGPRQHSAFRLHLKTHMRSAVLCWSLNNSVWFQFDWNIQYYFVLIRKTFIDIFVALTKLRKKLLHTLYHKKTHKMFFAQKKQRKILLACGLSIRQLPALGCWNVTLLLLLLLQKKCEYHRTSCDYLEAAACQDSSAWNERRKLQHFYQLVVNMVWDLWKVQCELLLAATFSVLCWTLNLHWNVLLGSSEKIISRDDWITAFSQINGCYSSRCPSCLLKTVKCECLWSSWTDGSSSYLLLKIKQLCSSQNRQLFT